MNHYDIVYLSKIFDETYTKDIDWCFQAECIVKGGTGYVRRDKMNFLWINENGKWIQTEDTVRGVEKYMESLPYEMEHIYPDYSLYPELTKDTAYGFLTRGCPNGCGFCIVSPKEGWCSIKVADLSEWWRGQRNIMLMDPNLTACRDAVEILEQLAESGAWVDFNQGLDIRLLTDDMISVLNRIKYKNLHFAWDNPKEDLREKFEHAAAMLTRRPNGAVGTVYCLTNYGSSIEEDLYRIYTLREIGYDPDVRVYDKPHAPQNVRDLQRWCNNRLIYKSCPNFEDYKPRRKTNECS